jgi:hypothetical protein
LAEVISLIIRVGTVEARFPGGMVEYARHCPNGTFCTDGEICRVGFMHFADAQKCAEQLQSLGFLPSEIALTNDSEFLWPCDWLQLRRQAGVAVARLQGTELTSMMTPGWWRPGNQMQCLSTEELNEDYDIIGVRENVEIYRHRKTGKEMYVGRANLQPRKRWWQFWK